MNVVLAETAAESAGGALLPGVVNAAAIVLGLVSLLLVAAWWAYLYR